MRIADWAKEQEPRGRADRAAGHGGQQRHRDALPSWPNYELPYRFEPKSSRRRRISTAGLTAKEIAQRRDFRNVTTFTVDPPTPRTSTTRFRYARSGKAYVEIGVHIADVTHYVQALHSVIDDEAVERRHVGLPVDRTVPMLPRRLSNELCSLRPHEASLCFSAYSRSTKAGTARRMGSAARSSTLTAGSPMAEAQEIIETGRGDFAKRC